MTSPSRDESDGDDPTPPVFSDLALQLWVLALLVAQFMLACWWFGRMYST